MRDPSLSPSTVSRRTALAGLGVGGFGLAASARHHRARAQEATPQAGATPVPPSDLLASGFVAFDREIKDPRIATPSDVEVGPDGRIWIPDQATNTIFVLGSSGELLDRFGSPGSEPGQFQFGDFGSIDVDGEGTVFVLDTYNHRVQEFDADLEFVRQWGASGFDPGEFAHPSDIEVAPNGDIYVCDAERSDVQRFSREGEYIGSLSPGTGGEEFKEPALIGIDEAGSVYVPDISRIHVFDADGDFERTIKTTEAGNGEISVGFDAAATVGGYLFVSDVQRARVAVFDADGRAIGYFGERGAAAGQFDEISNLTLDGDGTLYVLDYANHRIQAFRLPRPDHATPVASP